MNRYIKCCVGFVSCFFLSYASHNLHGDTIADSTIEFNRDIRPILSEHCFACHGPDKGHREADLRLDVDPTLESKKTSEHPAIVAGDPTASELVRRILSNDESEVMPPPESRKPLTEKQKALLQEWIRQGAKYQGHWAYTPLQRPEMPSEQKENNINPIDQFVDAKLKQIGLSANEEADRRTLIRRLSLDLCGLPPSPERVDAFVNDSASDAYDKLVDELLASKAFAEKQTIHWLDAVRYSDTSGFHGDQDIDVWPYRDYVLNAFHNNKPFDQFTREQITGDLLPNPTQEQLTATAFNRLNRMSTEGGAQDKEYRAKYAADRVRTVGMTWLGSTLGCCECHDHKYDPFSAKDFYAMAAFFGDIEEFGFYPNGFDQGDWGPTLQLTSEAQQARLKKFDEQIAALDDSLSRLQGNASEIESKLQQLIKDKQIAWKTIVPLSASSAEGAVLTVSPDGLVAASGPNPDFDSHTLVLKPGTGEWTTLRIVNEVDESLPGNRVARGWKSFVISELEVNVTNLEQTLAPVKLSAVQVDRDSHRYPGEAAIDGLAETGWAVEHGHSGRHTLSVTFATPVRTDESTLVTVKIVQRSDRRHATLGRYRVSMSQVPAASQDQEGISKPLADALQVPAADRTEEHRNVLQTIANRFAQLTSTLQSQRTALVAQKRTFIGSIPRVLYTKQAAQPRVVRLLPRGNWMDDSGEIMKPLPPEFLLQDDERKDANRTRLDLANWLTSRDNPLTARTLVNRWWQQFFGVGLSKQLEDIGSQGHWPSHPELLDWLACEFIEPSVAPKSNHGWNVKHIIRTIVTSKTYKRSSLATSDQLAMDPANQWLARQATFRVDAEVIRDTALVTSGLLDDEFGGPSIRPYQPSGYWLALNYPKQEYAPSFGTDQYRRSVYVHWQRTFLHPSLLAFDASTREECQVARAVSNTPLQALTLLNDPIFVEAARSLGSRALAQEASSLSERIRWLGRQVLVRDLTSEEESVLVKLYESELQNFQQSLGAAGALLSVGELPNSDSHAAPELAAMTMVARVVYNLHETITRN